jgi:hypothetical protein
MQHRQDREQLKNLHSMRECDFGMIFAYFRNEIFFTEALVRYVAVLPWQSTRHES